jgi:hypothetical protein
VWVLGARLRVANGLGRDIGAELIKDGEHERIEERADRRHRAILARHRV